MGPLMNLLDNGIEFVFLDGEVECPRAAGKSFQMITLSN